ncbi:MAG: acetylornithine transaminase [Acidaminococcaceae bacterium]|nr:acetylornithine transaminase [Acidaminococcaceae bacterium]
MNKQTVIEQTEKYYLPVFGRYPIVADHGKGCYLYDIEGKEYLDFLAGIAVNSLGYAHPTIVKAVSEQASKMMHTSNLFYSEPQAKLVRLFSEVSGFDRVFLANSGSEANEGALKIARKYGKQRDASGKKFRIIFANHSFHGRTMATVTITGTAKYKLGLEPLPAGYEMVEYGDIEALKALMTDDVCGVILEPIQGEGGVHVPPNEYFREVKALCERHDALLIFDEVQTGVGRTGKWFGYMHTGVKPDVITFAKGIGDGFPMGGFAVTERLAHVFKPGEHGGTFGGNALACAVGYAVLATIKADGLVEKAAEQGAYFKGKLLELQRKYPDKVQDVRGRGLLLGMELSKPGAAVADSCLHQHAIVNCTAGNVIRLVPPLIVTAKEIDKVIAALDNALANF